MSFDNTTKEQLLETIEMLQAQLVEANQTLAAFRSGEAEAQQRAEAALRASAEYFRALIQDSSEITAVIDGDGTVRYASPAIQRVLGYDEQEIVGLTFGGFVHPDDLSRINLVFSQALQLPATRIMVELRARHKDGSWCYLEVVGSNLLHNPAVKGIVANARDVTARRRAEDALAQERDLLRTLIDTVPDYIFAKDANGRFVLANAALARLLGVPSPDQVVGKMDSDFFIEREMVAQCMTDEQLVIQSGQPLVNREESIAGHDGDQRWVLTTKVPLRDRQGQVVQLLGISRDITERKQAQEQLRFQAHLLDTVGQAVVAVNLDGDVIFWNRYAESLYGWSTDEVMGRHAAEFMRSRGSDDQAAVIIAHLRSGESWSGELLVKRRDETTFPALVTNTPLYNETGTLIGLVGVSGDITERKRIEEAEHEQRLIAETLASVTLALTSQLSLDSVLDEILRQAQRLVPHTAAQIALLVGDRIRPARWQGFARFGAEEFIAHQTQALAESPLDIEVIKSQKPLIIADTARDPRWIVFEPTAWIKSALLLPICLHDHVLGELELDSDTPDRFNVEQVNRLQPLISAAAIALENAKLYADLQRNAQELEQHVNERTEELRQAKQHVEAILNNSADAIVVSSRDGAISQVNPAFGALFGYRPDEVFRRPLYSFVVGDSVQRLRSAFSRVASERSPVQIELETRRKDGTTFSVDIGLSMMGDQHDLQGDGLHPELVCSIRDITQRKRTEEELRRAFEQERELSKLRSRLVSMASHDFRTPMTVILTSSELLQFQMQKLSLTQVPESFEKYFTRIKDSVRHMTQLLEEVLTYSLAEAGKLEINPGLIDLEGFCQTLLEEARLSSSANHELSLSLVGQPGPILLDPQLLHRILSNLLSNAVKYSPAGGPVLLTVKNEPGKTEFLVQDEGIGIPEEDQKYLFEPFHRAANVGAIQGTGLGLAIVKQAVDALDGTIALESQDGKGTTFTVTLPHP